MILLHILFVGVGGFFGAIARFAMNKTVGRITFTNLSISTLVVNLIGSFLLGIFIGGQLSSELMLLIGVGFLGSFTTFSTFTLESIQMFLEKKRLSFLLYQIFSYAGGIAAAFLGITFTQIV